MEVNQVTVIVPTIGDGRRADTIWRTIESAGLRSGVSTHIIVVVNGDRFSPTLLRQLKATPRVQCAQLAIGNLPLALKYGRSLVTTEFFAFIDDDDEFLEGGLKARLDTLRADPDLAFVVTNGVFVGPSGQEHRLALHADQIESNPLRSLLQENWVATSASGLYRTSAVSMEDFEAMPPYLEWTYLGFQLASRLPFRFLDRPTYRHYDMPGSVSKSKAYHVGMVAALEVIIELSLPHAIKRGLRRKLGAAHHALSRRYLDSGDLAQAKKHHWRSLRQPAGLRYTSYTRKLYLPRRRWPKSTNF